MSSIRRPGGQPGRSARRARAPSRAPCRDPSACRLRGSLGQDDVLGHRHHRDQHEVLVHHPDADLDGVARRAQVERLAARTGSRPRPACTGRRGRSSASTCRRRSRPAARAPRPAPPRGRCASFATRLPKRLVIPRSSSSGVSAMAAGSVPGGAGTPAPRVVDHLTVSGGTIVPALIFASMAFELRAARTAAPALLIEPRPVAPLVACRRSSTLPPWKLPFTTLLIVS